MHYGMLLLAMCLVCVYGAPLVAKLDRSNSCLRKYVNDVEDKIEKSGDMSLSSLEEKDDNSSKSNMEPEELSSQEEDLNDKQLENEIQFREKRSAQNQPKNI